MTKRIILRYTDDMPASPFWRRIEQLARADRLSLNLRFGQPCEPRRLVQLYDVQQVLETHEDYETHFGRCMRIELQGLDHWSGLVLRIGNPQYLIFANPYHSRTRRTLTIAHEFGHMAHSHQPLTFAINGSEPTSLYSNEQEQEAYGYGLAMLLPYAPLIQMLQQKASIRGIAQHYDVSNAAVEMRMRQTGIWALRGST